MEALDKTVSLVRYVVTFKKRSSLGLLKLSTYCLIRFESLYIFQNLTMGSVSVAIKRFAADFTVVYNRHYKLTENGRVLKLSLSLIRDLSAQKNPILSEF